MKRKKRSLAAAAVHRAYHRARYLELRAKLFKAIGETCAKETGLADDPGDHHEELHVDHIDGRSWEPRSMGSYARVKRYLKELEAGVRLRPLCKICNGWDGFRRASTKRQNRKTKKEQENGNRDSGSTTTSPTQPTTN